MVGNITYYIVRSLWTLAGVGNIALAAAIDGNDSSSLLVKIIAILAGIITVWLSIFFKKFLDHLSDHSKDRAALFEAIDKKLNEIKETVCPSGADDKKDIQK